MREQVQFIDRRGTNCVKWDGQTENYGEEGLQAMWVADMDFKVASCITEAIQQYTEMGAFGYYKVPESYLSSFIKWEKQYHHYEVQADWIRFAPGVVPAINWLIQMFTKEEDAVIVQTPVYYPFLDAVKNNGRKLVTCDLINTGGVYTIDFAAFEQAIKENKVKVFILCSPHNPVGRVWTKEEIRNLMEICKKHQVFVIADEIHQDIILGEHMQHPAASLGQYEHMMVTLTAATKTFNLAACQNSFVIIADEGLRSKYDEFTKDIRITSGNAFGYIAVEAAYSNGRPWFEGVKHIIEENAQYVRDTLVEELPRIEVSPLEGTYLLWMNLNAYLKPEEVKEMMQKKCGLAFDYGEWFGGEEYAGYVRMNLATSREMVEKAVVAIVRELK